MSDLPCGWVEAGFGQLFDFKGGSQPPKATFSDHQKGGYVRLLQIRDFDSDAKAVFIKDHPRWPKCTADDIMIGRYGASVGRILTGKSGAYNVALVKMIFEREFFDASWVRLFLLSDYFQYPLRRISRSAQNGFNKADLEQIKVPLAPLREQRRIVAKVDSVSSKSKRARDHFDHIPRLVEKYKQAILAAAFRGELSSKVTNWHQSAIGNVCDLIDGDRGPNYPKREDYLPEGYCLFLSTKNVRPDGFDFSECQFLSEEKHRILRKGTLTRGDVVITTRGTIGNVAYYGAAIPYDVVRINSGMLIMRPNQKLSGEYLAWYVRSPLYESEIEQQRTGTAQPQLPAGIMKRFPIRFPELSEQKLIVRSIEATFTWVDRLAKEAASGRKLIDHLDQAVLAKAFRGELLPQDPNDEPASVLLERIKTEKRATTQGDRKARQKAQRRRALGGR
jgi:type I restriction enzyme S subunit